jgi:choline dehydrogenase-like flavoprotein
MTEFDYLVVGGGTAGCIVAARLAEDPAVTVGLIEWGPSDEHEPRARSIRRWAEMLEGEYDLDYRSVPQERGNSGIRQARLRILGGCSTANTMISWRPRVADLQEWVDLGARGWDAATMHPYYERLQAPITPVPPQDQNPVRRGRGQLGERSARPAGPVHLERRGRARGHRLLRDRLPRRR